MPKGNPVRKTTDADETRIEHDTLGEVRVPHSALFGAQTQRARENFPISGLRLPRRFIRAQGLIKQAAAHANGVLGELPPAIARAIQQAAAEVAEGIHDEQFVVDVYQAGAGTSQNMNANEVIARRAEQLLGRGRAKRPSIHPNDHVNMAQSTNDTIPTAINVAAAEAWKNDLRPALVTFQKHLGAKARRWMKVVKSGRTHLQDAVPMRLGQEVGGWAEAVQRDIDRIDHAATELLLVPLGGNAVGTGINAHPDYRGRAVRELARLTGMRFRSAPDLFEGIQNVSAAHTLSAALRGLAITLGRIAADIRLLGSGPRTGLAELELPAVQPGSSIMPGKVNPVMAEMLNMVCFQVVGNDSAIAAAMNAGQLELNVMMPVIAHNLLFSMQIIETGVRAFDERCLKGLRPNRNKCRSWVEQSLAVATALNPLVGYARAAAIAEKAHREGLTVREVAVREGLVSEEAASRLLDPERLADPGGARKYTGGSAT